jgi:hypothetical protein
MLRGPYCARGCTKHQDVREQGSIAMAEAALHYTLVIVFSMSLPKFLSMQNPFGEGNRRIGDKREEYECGQP